MTSICTNFSIWRQNKQKHDEKKLSVIFKPQYLNVSSSLFLDLSNWRRQALMEIPPGYTSEYFTQQL